MHTLIVGAGSAGCVLAARLSESGEQEVSLVEAGPDYAPASLPRALARGGENALTGHDWGLKHRPNAKQVALFPFPRGRVVGGSSAVNTCIALRGQPEDYDEWAARGLPEWSWERVLPAFRRLERDLDHGEADHHGADGPLPVRRHPESEWTPWQAAFVHAARDLGYGACADTNAPGATGAGPHAMNKIDGRRISAAEAWLSAEVRARENLTLFAETEALRVRFRGRRAVGLEVRDAAGTRTIPADRVLLAAGATWTPVLLLRSGVGPAADLDRLGVARVADNPAVGARLLDHPGCAMFFLPRFGVVRRGDPLIQTVARYTSAGSTVRGDMQIQPGSKLATRWGTLPLCSIMAAVGKPQGTGRLRVRSVRPGVRPRIESRLLDHPADRATAVDAMERAARIARHPEVRALARHLWPTAKTLRDRDAIDAWIRKATDSGYHPSGTVPMGADDDPDAATDAHGRVRGTEGLHVADASLFPTIPSSNTNLPTLMVGERLAELLG